MNLFEQFSGHILQPNEDYYTYTNEYNEPCYVVYDINTNEVIERNAF